MGGSGGFVATSATGERKREALSVLLEGPQSPRWPCTLLRDHPSFDVLVDRAAARGMR